jgi:HEAT repeat protein
MLPKWLLICALAAGAGWIGLNKMEDPVLKATRQLRQETAPDHRLAAIQQFLNLARRGCDLATAHPLLIHTASHDSVAEIRACALEALANGPTQPPEWLGVVLQALHDPEAKVRRAAVYAISAQTHEIPLPSAWETALLERLLDSDPATHRAAALLLIERADLNGVVLPALRDCLGHSNAVIRRNAVHALFTLGTDSCPLLPELSRALNDPDRKVRFMATRTIALLDPAQARPRMLELARSSPDELERLCAWDWLDRNATPDAQLLAEIEIATRDVNPHVSRLAADTLARWIQNTQFQTLSIAR